VKGIGAEWLRALVENFFTIGSCLACAETYPAEAAINATAGSVMGGHARVGYEAADAHL